MSEFTRPCLSCNLFAVTSVNHLKDLNFAFFIDHFSPKLTRIINSNSVPPYSHCYYTSPELEQMAGLFSHSHNLLINLIGSIIEPTTPPQKIHQHRRLQLALWEQHKPNDLALPLFNLDDNMSPLAVNSLLNSHSLIQSLHHSLHSFSGASLSQYPAPFPATPSVIIMGTSPASKSGGAKFNASSNHQHNSYSSHFREKKHHHHTKRSSSSSIVSDKENLPPTDHFSLAKVDKEFLTLVAKSPLADIKKDIFRLSKDQYGCRLLQKKIDENAVPHLQTRLENFEIIFQQVYPHFYELIIDPFGNYLVQKLIHYCDGSKLNLILEILHCNLFQISINQHGTRALQKIIDGLFNDYQLSLLTKGLQPYIIELIKDLNGNHVIQKILNKFSPNQCQFIYQLILNDLIVVATHKHGCCVLQKCLNHVTATQLLDFSSKILEFGNFYKLINDQFGNYVLQYLISLNQIEISYRIYENFLKFGIGLLCNLKFSLNVVEKFLKNCYQNELNMPSAKADGQRELNNMFRSLSIDNNAEIKDTAYMFADLKYELVFQILSLDLNRLINDPFGNYVIQTLLDVLHSSTPSKSMNLLVPQEAILTASISGSLADNIQIQVIKQWFLNCKIVSSFGKRIQLKINSILNSHMQQQQNIYKIPRQQMNMNANGEFVVQEAVSRGNGTFNTLSSGAAPSSGTAVSPQAAVRHQDYQFVPNYYQSYTTHPMNNPQHGSSYMKQESAPSVNSMAYHRSMNSHTDDMIIPNSMISSLYLYSNPDYTHS